MRDCYHKSCDDFNRTNVKDINYKFLATITEAVILTVIELSASGRASKTKLGGCEFSIDKNRSDDDRFDDNIDEDAETEIKKEPEISLSYAKVTEKDENKDLMKPLNESMISNTGSCNNTTSIVNGEQDLSNAKDIRKSENNKEVVHLHEGGNTIYNSEGGTQVNIGNVNIALSLPFDTNNDDNSMSFSHRSKPRHNHEESFIPKFFEEPTYTNIIDYLVKKVYNSNEYNNRKKDSIDAKNVDVSKQKQYFKEKSRNKMRKENSPMIVHILDEADDIPYSIFNEIGDN